MRLAKLLRSQKERRWPPPRDAEFVKAAAALLGFSIEPAESAGLWKITTPLRWFLYGTVQDEVQGPWIPETDDEWVLCLQRLYKEITAVSPKWARYPTVFDDIFRKEDVC